MFESGQQVRVKPIAVSLVNGVVTGRVPQREFVGTVVKYFRNGDYLVCDDLGCTQAYPEEEIEALA